MIAQPFQNIQIKRSRVEGRVQKQKQKMGIYKSELTLRRIIENKKLLTQRKGKRKNKIYQSMLELGQSYSQF